LWVENDRGVPQRSVGTHCAYIEMMFAQNVPMEREIATTYKMSLRDKKNILIIIAEQRTEP